MISFSVNLDLGNIQQQVEEAVDAGQKQLDQEVLKGSNYFIPKDTGELERSGVRASQIGKGKIIWDQPYARKLYYNPQYNFSKDVNPNAQGLWFEAAKARFLSDWVRMTQQAIDRHL
ncbi:minor capsid protein [Cytobacillus oceanisediminis]|uniref:minor capsid protein n=1 Tax=Cytobacillus oceanisediminis TaxID=665099 RepID=UPI001C218C77|nr:minor capsid protein [Cytobacillus oceanisediminis]MBU8768701.1 minor capsid protein [Cytobacillus oceanisediminis]